MRGTGTWTKLRPRVELVTGRKAPLGLESRRRFVFGRSGAGGAAAAPWNPQAHGEGQVHVRCRLGARGEGADGRAFCWGLNEFGQSGTEPEAGEQCSSQYVAGTVPCVSAPRQLSATLRFRQISTGRNHACGVTTNGELYCWGRNDAGQLGHGRIAPYSPHPVKVAAALR
jgi:hypothetical protein